MAVDRNNDRLCWFDGEPAHWCPGCGELHAFAVYRERYSGDRWTYNENRESPTFEPAMKIVEPSWRLGREPFICHYEVRDGVIHYAADCTHVLAGEKVPLPKIPALWPAYAL